jgi:hypothetical protein
MTVEEYRRQEKAKQMGWIMVKYLLQEREYVYIFRKLQSFMYEHLQLKKKIDMKRFYFTNGQLLRANRLW